MKHPAQFLALTALAVVLAAGPVRADENEYAKIMIHIVPVGSVGGNKCSSNKARPACQDMVTKGKLNEPYYAYLVVTDANPSIGLAGLQCGIDYNGARRLGVDVIEWSLCGALQFPFGGWPNPGGSNQITWDAENNCQRSEPGGVGTGVTGVAGYFYITAYTADKFEVIPRPVDNAAKVADCAARETLVAGAGAPIFPRPHLGFVTFSEGASEDGYNPCGQARPVQETTWSGVKSNPNGN